LIQQSMKIIEPTYNELLHSHVTRVGFDLTLGKSHIAALVMLDQSIKQRRYIREHATNSVMKRAFSWFGTGMSGCCERGLVIHHWNQKAVRETLTKDRGLAPHYTITKAGQLVIALLKESGVYQEYASVLVEKST
jgi:hypothetical protein